MFLQWFTARITMVCIRSPFVAYMSMSRLRANPCLEQVYDTTTGKRIELATHHLRSNRRRAQTQNVILNRAVRNTFMPSLGDSTTLWVKKFWPQRHLLRAPCKSNVEFVQQPEFFFTKAASL